MLDFLYSLYFNFRYLNLRQAIKMPIRITTNLQIEKLKRGQIIVKNNNYRSVSIGLGKSPGIQSFKSSIYVETGGSIIFLGTATISQGSVLRCDKNATIEIGDSFYCNCNCYLRSTTQIVFGKDCSLGWKVTLNTSDGHEVWYNGDRIENESPIIIGDNVWLTPECSILKKTVIANCCIVTQKSVVNKKFLEEHCLIGGIPAKIIKKNVNWKA